jgi:hypothetical protein
LTKKVIVVNVNDDENLLNEVIDEILLRLNPRSKKVDGINTGTLGFSFKINLSKEKRTYGFRYYLSSMQERNKKEKKGACFPIR